MTWTVEWSPRSERDLLNLPHWRDAERIAIAVRHFAETGEGDLRAIPGTGEHRFYVARVGARLSFDVADRVLHVWYVFALK